MSVQNYFGRSPVFAGARGSLSWIGMCWCKLSKSNTAAKELRLFSKKVSWADWRSYRVSTKLLVARLNINLRRLRWNTRRFLESVQGTRLRPYCAIA